ncbi:PREDICTED: EGF domain-specific O-linked N-acetylglucosamine transferase-like [Nelumbo nucifera]|uniref:EGF domain-specific O-linked N-acetylglucosamine transferase-like n=2 Tax=Nelumbo nucifera TaxID=4432 RepID=A0A1U7ZVH7_NELNU|nr:PREDICTED: EGF domain-specific O-linked N-acetylglucosamine transferase-like [Nelumbo nucifera]DAD23443.1 TPA_asm: hypothetical protein HUJ06_024906 [Nelumbo nucifera]
MAKESPRVALTAASFFALLLPLLYLAFFRSDTWSIDSWRQQLTDRFSANTNNHDEDKGPQAQDIKEENPLKLHLRRLVRGKNLMELETTGYSCESDIHSDVCVADQQVKIDMRSLTIYLSSKQIPPDAPLRVRPYPKKEDENNMRIVTPVEIKIPNSTFIPPACDVTHDVPAVIFATTYTGNIYHEFNEIAIPLFLTCRHFQSRIRFIVTDFNAWWVTRFDSLLSGLSSYGIINPADDGRVHCFPAAVVGLKYHDTLYCNTSRIPGGYSTLDFKQFLRESFNLRVKHESEIPELNLVLISRKRTRMFVNEEDLVRVAEGLGYHVTRASPEHMANLRKFSGVLNRCNVLVGAHGAGLTNMVFLPEGAVVVQVVGWGLEWASEAYYGGPSHKMGIYYLEYKIDPDETTLIDVYGRDHPVITDPWSIHRQGYNVSRAVYIDGQNFRINVDKFRKTLEEALKLVGRSASPSPP